MSEFYTEKQERLFTILEEQLLVLKSIDEKLNLLMGLQPETQENMEKSDGSIIEAMNAEKEHSCDA